MSSSAVSLPAKRPWLSLPIRISISLVAAAIIPLLVTFIFISTQTIQTLTDQSTKSMTNDAQAHAQQISDYFTERLLDLQTVQNAAEQVPQTIRILTVDQPGSPQFVGDLTTSYYVVTSGYVRDTHYENWSVFYKTGQIAFYYPLNTKPQNHGSSLIPANILQQVDAGKITISPVYYSPTTKKASVDLYAPILELPQVVNAIGTGSQNPTSVQQSATPGSAAAQQSSSNISSQQATAAASQQAATNPASAQAAAAAAAAKAPVIGILRSTINLDYVWDTVQKETNSNGDGSYAFVVDENGVRIADTNHSQLFSSIAPLNATTQQTIQSEQRYGSSSAVSTLSDPKLKSSTQRNSSLDTFQEQPTGSNQNYLVVREATTVVPWNYIVLSPTNTVTAVARTQQLNIAIVALIAAIIVAIVGALVGRGISRPILRAVEDLQDNSQSLNTLATRQQDAASEQVWVVDASQVGLQSVQYYTQATKFASNQLHRTANNMLQYWMRSEPQEMVNNLGQVTNIANYIENATIHQDTSNQKLGTALKVATQVTEQLHDGATSASEAANKLEKIVEELRGVVGE